MASIDRAVWMQALEMGLAAAEGESIDWEVLRLRLKALWYDWEYDMRPELFDVAEKAFEAARASVARP